MIIKCYFLKWLVATDYLTNQSLKVDTLFFCFFYSLLLLIFHLQIKPRQRMMVVKIWHLMLMKFVRSLRSCNGAQQTIFYGILWCLLPDSLYSVHVVCHKWHFAFDRNFTNFCQSFLQVLVSDEFFIHVR